jgi:hypothetical protein
MPWMRVSNLGWTMWSYSSKEDCEVKEDLWTAHKIYISKVCLEKNWKTVNTASHPISGVVYMSWVKK